jgi:peptidyl-prolyl cis-trans isomerase SurA
VVMSSELRERLDVITRSLKASGREIPPQDVMVRQTLDQLILESIQMQMGRRAGVRISDAQLNASVTRIASQNQMSLDQFRIQLEKEGQSYQGMRESIRQEMILQRVQQGNVNQRIQISEDEIRNYLESKEGEQLTSAEYRLFHALLSVPEDSSPETETDSKVYVEALFARIQNGEPYDKAIAGSAAPYTFAGGDLGWRKAGDLPSLFSGIAPEMDIGQTAPPIRSPSGWHMIYLAEKRGGKTVIEQTHVRHILIKPTAIRDEEDSRELAVSLRQRIEDGEDFVELAKEYSDDIGSAQEGGDLGWASPRQMVPEFEKVMNETAINELSQPVQSQFGWHVLQVLERRNEDVSETVSMNRANEVLHKRKYQEELDAWLRKIRDEAFVDIK